MKKKSAAPARKKAAALATVSATAKSKPSMAVAIIALFVNLFIPVIAGLGTIIGGRIKHGIIQLLVIWLGVLVTFIGFFVAVASPMTGVLVAMLGSLMVLAGWVWAIISGVLIVREASL